MVNSLISEADPEDVIFLDDDDEEDAEQMSVNSSSDLNESSSGRNRRSTKGSVTYDETSDDENKRNANNEESEDEFLVPGREEPFCSIASKKAKKTAKKQPMKPPAMTSLVLDPQPFSGYLCLICPAKKSKFNQLKDMMAHLLHHHQKPNSRNEPNKIHCPKCSRIISTSNVQHFSNHDVLKRIFECTICFSESLTLAGAVAHMKIHRQLSTSTKTTPKQAKPVASTSKAAAVPPPLALVSSASLSASGETDNVFKVYKCAACDKMFSSRTQCISHRIRVHNNYHRCDYCGTEYKTAALFDNCIRKHHMEFNIMPVNPTISK